MRVLCFDDAEGMASEWLKSGLPIGSLVGEGLVGLKLGRPFGCRGRPLTALVVVAQCLPLPSPPCFLVSFLNFHFCGGLVLLALACSFVLSFGSGAG